MKIVADFYVERVSRFGSPEGPLTEGGEPVQEVELRGMTAAEAEGDGFHPQGSITLRVVNPNLARTFSPGQRFRVMLEPKAIV